MVNRAVNQPRCRGYCGGEPRLHAWLVISQPAVGKLGSELAAAKQDLNATRLAQNGACARIFLHAHIDEDVDVLGGEMWWRID